MAILVEKIGKTILGTAFKVKSIGLFLFFIFNPIIIVAQGIEKDSVSVILQEIEVRSTGFDNNRRGSKIITSESLLTGIRIMGESDPLNQLKFISGVRTSGDYGSGLMIDGNTPSQSLFRIDGAPLFFPYRFGGIFSTFNGPHFTSMVFERGFHKASMPARLGSKVDFISNRLIKDKVSGVANVGMTSSSITIKVPVKSKVEIDFSGRISYIDEIYGKWLKGDSEIGYKFWDLNLTTLWCINDKNQLLLNGFINKDHLSYGNTNYAMDTHLSWGNHLASLSWLYNGGQKTDLRLYWSGFNNDFTISLPQVGMKMPSSISILGFSGDMSSWLKENTLKLGYGFEINSYIEDSGKVSVSGFEAELKENSNSHFKPFETRIYGDLSLPINNQLNCDLGISSEFFSNSDRYKNFTIDPRISLDMKLGGGHLDLHFGRYSQYIHQVGFSQIGLASDFWISSRKKMPGAHSYNFELDYRTKLGSFIFSVSTYYKIIRNEQEYEGQLLNLLDINYDPIDWIKQYNGYNCGINFNSNFSETHITANLSVSYGVAKRYNKASGEYFRAASEPGLMINLEGNYILNQHWEIGAIWRYASGRPYTRVKALFMIGGNLITEYGKQNSALFPSTHQLDLSITWKAISKINQFNIEHFVNFSFINAYGHKNTEIMDYVFDPETGNFKLKKVYSLYRFFPSLSYTIKF